MVVCDREHLNKGAQVLSKPARTMLSARGGGDEQCNTTILLDIEPNESQSGLRSREESPHDARHQHGASSSSRSVPLPPPPLPLQQLHHSWHEDGILVRRMPPDASDDA